MLIKNNRLIHLLNCLLDQVLARIRYIFVPFYLLIRLTSLLRNLFLYFGNEYLKTRMAHCGDGVRIYGDIRITAPEKLYIGDNVHINMGGFFRAEGGLRIEDNVHIGRNLTVYTMNHNYNGDSLPYDSTLIYKPVTINENVWIGMNVCITPGVTIGEGAIIGMGTVVSKDVPALAIVGGVPLTIKKYRDAEHYYALKETGRFSGMSGEERIERPVDQ